MSNLTNITFNGKVYAILIRNDFSKDGVEFFTPNDYSQQLAYMKHPAGKKIDAHIHNSIKREVFYTQEVLVIKKGLLRVDFYMEDKTYIESIMLQTGDIILLVSGGHGFECIEEVEMIEIKQGPYLGEQDKTRFGGVSDKEVRLVR